jgi:t-SNARE complex subunit (syntaxin)
MLRTNSSSILENQCHQADPFPSHAHKFNYHQLKNHIHERQKKNYVSSISHYLQRIPNVRFHRSKKIVSKVKKQKEHIHVGHFHVQKKNSKEVYMEQIKDTLRVTCAICEELH